MNFSIKRLPILCLFLSFVFLFSLEIKAQEQKPAITISTVLQTIDGKKYYVHVVQQGQTLFSIARAYGSRYQESVIKTDIDKLSIGDTVWIPCPEQQAGRDPDDSYYKYYEVKAGETLYGISRNFQLKETDVIALNPELETSSLKAGQIIKIPQIQKDTVFATPTKREPEVSVIKNVDSVIHETPVKTKLIINDLHDKSTICLALIMPFYLNDASEISVSKLDIEQKRKRSYKSFQYIQFYEGMLLALEKLEKQGYQIKLYIYDISEDDSEGVKRIFEKPELKEVDLIITLLRPKAFETAASSAMKINTFIINPLSDRVSIIENNPYVFKLIPSVESYANSTVALINNNFKDPNIFLIHSDKATETIPFKAFKTALENQKSPYTLFNWAASSSLGTHLKKDKENIIISIYDEKGQKNQVYVINLLNRLLSFKNNIPVLFGPNYWLEYENIDFTYLQRTNFHFVNNFYLDAQNPAHKEFIDLFKETYKTDPNPQYASLGYDIVFHFVTGLKSKGKFFWEDPNIPPGLLLNPFYFKRKEPNNGFENSRNIFYKLQDYQIVPARKPVR